MDRARESLKSSERVSRCSTQKLFNPQGRRRAQAEEEEEEAETTSAEDHTSICIHSSTTPDQMRWKSAAN